jgi:hypothetical protein
MSNNGLPPLDDWQADNYPVIYDEGDATLKYVKTGVKNNINSGSSGYLSYVSILNQIGTSNPTADEKTNTTGQAITPVRDALGFYTLVFATPVPIGQLFMPGLNAWWDAGDGTIAIPITDESAIIGYVVVYTSGTATHVTKINIDTMDAAFNPVEWGGLITRFYFEFKLYT